MNCPYCQKEMSPGYLCHNDKPVQWIPEGENPSHWRFGSAAAGIDLKNSFSLFRRGGYRAEAHYCPACHIILAPTK